MENVLDLVFDMDLEKWSGTANSITTDWANLKTNNCVDLLLICLTGSYGSPLWEGRGAINCLVAFNNSAGTVFSNLARFLDNVA